MAEPEAPDNITKRRHMRLYIVREDLENNSLSYQVFNPTIDQTINNRYKIRELCDTEDEALEICTRPKCEVSN